MCFFLQHYLQEVSLKIYKIQKTVSWDGFQQCRFKMIYAFSKNLINVIMFLYSVFVLENVTWLSAD